MRAAPSRAGETRTRFVLRGSGRDPYKVCSAERPVRERPVRGLFCAIAGRANEDADGRDPYEVCSARSPAGPTRTLTHRLVTFQEAEQMVRSAPYGGQPL